jgi:Cu2+-exporting ATPase
MLNLTGPADDPATAAARDSFLAEMVRMMETVEAARSGYRRIADRASRLYAPVVHTAPRWPSRVARGTGDWHRALGVAVAVLIITCPCALGLAVPMVQVVAARRLFERGIMVKDGSALERLAEADMVLFDKTGTLTLGEPQTRNRERSARERWRSPRRSQRTPAILTRARLRAAARHADVRRGERAAWLGVEARRGSDVLAPWPRRLGAHAAGGRPAPCSRATARWWPRSSSTTSRARRWPRLAPNSPAWVSVSRSSPATAAKPVAALAATVGIGTARPAMLPSDKVAHIAVLQADRRARAHGRRRAQRCPGDGRGARLDGARQRCRHRPPGRRHRASSTTGSTPSRLPSASRARRAGLIRQNFALAVAYNAVAMPLASPDCFTPLIAALAMSGSSLLVVANALRFPATAGQAGAPRAPTRARAGPA